ncbi:MAG TPA: serine/threonine-protein kinase [Pseudonocardiaceae bacterium]|nr:serine/threonine-protein kinase [Pseudonocardiaceae bacterium]
MTEQDRLVAGRYRLGERVGVGAMGVVWRARDERLRRTVAVKQLLPQPGLDEGQVGEARERALREARIAARLQHPNVVIVYDVAEDDDQPWLIMEYVPSRSLAAALQGGPMPPGHVASIGAQAAAGLAAAHAVGVVHRDVKPGNVLLGEDGIVKIADFGISRAMDDVVLAATGVVTGTPAYLAPEMAKGEEPTPPSDVFSLGATLYAAVEGEPPFGLGDNPLALLQTVAGGKVRRPGNAGPLTLPLMSLLSPDPADRPTMREAQAELAALTGERSMPGGLPIADPSRAWTRPVAPLPRRPVGPVVLPPAAGPAAPPPAEEPDDSPLALLAAHLAEATQASAAPRKRRPPLSLVLAAVVVLLAAGATLLVVDRAGHGTPSAAGIARLPTAPATTAVTAPPSTTVPPTTVDDHLTLATMSDTVARYYDLLPGDVSAAYRMLAVGYRGAHSLGVVRSFYDGIESVSPSDFVQVGPNSVDATITFVTKAGATTHEPYEFRIVRRDGGLVISDAVQLARVTGM